MLVERILKDPAFKRLRTALHQTGKDWNKRLPKEHRLFDKELEALLGVHVPRDNSGTDAPLEDIQKALVTQLIMGHIPTQDDWLTMFEDMAGRLPSKRYVNTNSDLWSLSTSERRKYLEPLAMSIHKETTQHSVVFNPYVTESLRLIRSHQEEMLRKLLEMAKHNKESENVVKQVEDPLVQEFISRNSDRALPYVLQKEGSASIVDPIFEKYFSISVSTKKGEGEVNTKDRLALDISEVEEESRGVFWCNIHAVLSTDQQPVVITNLHIGYEYDGQMLPTSLNVELRDKDEDKKYTAEYGSHFLVPIVLHPDTHKRVSLFQRFYTLNNKRGGDVLHGNILVEITYKIKGLSSSEYQRSFRLHYNENWAMDVLD